MHNGSNRELEGDVVEQSTEGYFPNDTRFEEIMAPIFEDTSEATNNNEMEETEEDSISLSESFLDPILTGVRENDLKSFEEKNPKENEMENIDDIFGDFSYSVVDINEQTQLQRPKLEFKKLANLDDWESTNDSSRRSTFLGKTTMWNLPNEQINKERGELELSVEYEIFCGINSGEVHVVVTIQCYLLKKSSKRKRKLVNVSIARDWTGAFVLSISKSKTSGLTGTKRETSLIGVYPLLERFEFRILESNKQGCKFMLITDSVVVVLVSGQKSREKLEKYLNYSFGEIGRIIDDKDMLYYRLASVDFARTIDNSVNRAESSNELFDSLIDGTVIDLRTSLLELQGMLRNGPIRDNILSRLVSLGKSGSFHREKYPIFIEIYQECMYSLAPTSYLNHQVDLHQIFDLIIEKEETNRSLGGSPHFLLDRFYFPSDLSKKRDSVTRSSRLSFIKSFTTQDSFSDTFGHRDTELSSPSSPRSDEPHRGPDLLEHAKLLKNQLDVVYLVLKEWRGRDMLPRVDFPSEFTYIPRGIKVSRRCDREKEKLRMIHQKESQGVFLCSVCLCGEEIIADANGRLPSEKLSNMSFEKMERNEEDWEGLDWLFNLGESWSLSSCLGRGNKRHNLSSEIIKASLVLTKRLGSDLGLLYDRFISIPNTKCILILSVKRVTEKTQVLTSERYTWRSREISEHKLYQGLENIDPTARLNLMDCSFLGERWLENSVLYYDQYHICPLEKGTYLCYIRFCADFDGYSLLVDDKVRMMPPFEKIQDSIISEEEWTWLKNLNQNGRYLEPFSSSFFRAKEKLKDKLSIQSLDMLYQDQITIDENNQIAIVAYVENVESKNLNRSRMRNSVWRRLNVVENSNSFSFCSLSSKQLEERNLNLSRGIKTITEKGYSTDELHRISQDESITEYCNNETSRTIKRWITRVVLWRQMIANSGHRTPSMNNTQSIQKKKVTISNDSPFITELNVEEDESPATYSCIDTNFEELKSMKELIEGPSSFEVCQQLTEEFVERSLVCSVDKEEVRTVMKILDEIVSVLCSTEEIIVEACLWAKRKQLKRETAQNRETYKESIVGTSSREHDSVVTYDDHIQGVIAVFNNSLDKAKELLTMTTSVQDVIELIDILDSYDKAVHNQSNVKERIEWLNKNPILGDESLLLEGFHKDDNPLNDVFISQAITETLQEEFSIHEKLQQTVQKRAVTVQDLYSKVKNHRQY